MPTPTPTRLNRVIFATALALTPTNNANPQPPRPESVADEITDIRNSIVPTTTIATTTPTNPTTPTTEHPNPPAPTPDTTIATPATPAQPDTTTPTTPPTPAPATEPATTDSPTTAPPPGTAQHSPLKPVSAIITLAGSVIAVALLARRRELRAQINSARRHWHRRDPVSDLLHQLDPEKRTRLAPAALRAAQTSHTSIELLFTTPSPPPAGWSSSSDGWSWERNLPDPATILAASTEFAPLGTRTDNNALLWLSLTPPRVITITGQPHDAQHLADHIEQHATHAGDTTRSTTPSATAQHNEPAATTITVSINDPARRNPTRTRPVHLDALQALPDGTIGWSGLTLEPTHHRVDPTDHKPAEAAHCRHLNPDCPNDPYQPPDASIVIHLLGEPRVDFVGFTANQIEMLAVLASLRGRTEVHLDLLRHSLSPDRARKTIENRLSQLRRQLGTNPDGHPLLSDARPGRNGRTHYILDEQVVTDIDLLQHRLNHATQHPPPHDALDTLADGLYLLTGPPLQARSGYDFWPAEHGVTNHILNTVQTYCHRLIELSATHAPRIADQAQTALNRVLDE